MIQKIYVKYIMPFFLFQLLLIEVNCQMANRPTMRQGHASAYIDNKYYIYGGITKTNQPLRELYYLDCSVPFDTSRLKWEKIEIPPTAADLSTVNGLFAVGGVDNKTLFLTNNENPKIARFSTFDAQTNLWNTNTKLTIDAGVKRIQGGVMNNKGHLYSYGGYGGYGGYSPKTGFVNELSEFNTIDLRWSKRSIAPFSKRCCSGTVFLPKDQTIMYIGGYDGNFLPLKDVYLYDTINNNWSIKTTSGTIPSNRRPAAVLGLDGQRVIIYGGNTDPVTVRVLNLIDYSWSIPKVSGNIPRIRAWHSINVIGNYMVISFGFLVGPTGTLYDPNKESDVLLLDISNNDEYVWTTKFISPFSPDAKIPSPPDHSSQQAPNVGVVLVFIVALILLVNGSYYICYKRCCKKKTMFKQKGDVESNREIFTIRGNQRQIIDEILIDEKDYNYRQEAISSPSDEKPLPQQDMLQDFKTDLIQELERKLSKSTKRENVKYK